MNTRKVFNILNDLFKKRRRRTLYLGGFLAILFITAAYFSNDYLLVTPVEGGGFSEGMVGYPRFINPVLAQSPTDKDLSRLIFSGLLKKDSQGIYVPELAASLEIGENGTQYTLTLGEDISFHDGTPITSEDVLFTYKLIQDPLMKSPLYPKLLQTSVTLGEEDTIVFTIPEAQTDFEHNLTVGIMSKSQWKDISIEEFPFAEQNITPIGSGPYLIQNIARDNKQKISNFTLSAFRKNTLAPYIDTITIKFYEDQVSALDSFESGLVDNLGNISAQELLSLDRSLVDKNIQTQPLSRVFALFFNANNSPALQDPALRSAIANAIDRQEIIDNIFFTRANSIDGPLPRLHPQYSQDESQKVASAERAQKILADGGWAINDNGVYSKTSDSKTITASFTIHVPDVSELTKTVEYIKESLGKINILVEIMTIDEKSFTTDIIRPRAFESVLFGQIVEDPSQLFGFWHSSGIEDPGVNIAGYKSATTDSILERLLEGSQETAKTEQDYLNLQKQIRKDLPAVFLFTPHFIYASDTSIRQNNIKNISFASDRFEYISDWYIKTESILPWFDIDKL